MLILSLLVCKSDLDFILQAGKAHGEKFRMIRFLSSRAPLPNRACKRKAYVIHFPEAPLCLSVVPLFVKKKEGLECEEEAKVYVTRMGLQPHRAFDIFLLIHSHLREKRHLLR